MSENCPECGHPWGSHQGRNGGQTCVYRLNQIRCPCKRMNPEVEAEDRRAARAWNGLMGRP